MPKGSTFANDMLALFFNATAIANLAQNNATSPSTNITAALHTAAPVTLQTSNEIAYTGYARVNVARTTGGWPAPSGGVISPAAAITFGAMTAGAGGTVTHFSLGSGTSNYMLYSGTVTPNISVVNGVTPQLTTASTVTET